MSAARFDCDVLVVGGGPSGAAAAAHLATAGLHVIVADWQVFPRDKVCGDFVSPVALGELDALGITGMTAFKRARVVREAAVYLDGRHMLTSAIPAAAGSSLAARVIPRKTLDAWILARARAAGAEILEGCRATSFDTSGAPAVSVALRHSGGERVVRARVLIGADGSTSTVARQMRGSVAADGGDDRLIAVRCYFAGMRQAPSRAELFFSSETFPGYCWLFPTGRTTANVGVGTVLKTVPPSRVQLRSQLLSLVSQDRALKRRLAGARPVGPIAGWPLATFNPRLPVVADRVLLVGDAGGFINPLNGEGIQSALLSARWAADVVTACARAGRGFGADRLQPYAARVTAELGADMAVSRSVVDLIRNRALNPLWLEALKMVLGGARIDPRYARVTGGVLAGVIPTRQLLSAPVMRRTLEQAAVRLGAAAVRRLSFRPTDLARLGVGASRAAIDVMSKMLEDQTASNRWATSLAATLADLRSHGRGTRTTKVARIAQGGIR